MEVRRADAGVSNLAAAGTSTVPLARNRSANMPTRGQKAPCTKTSTPLRQTRRSPHRWAEKGQRTKAPNARVGRRARPSDSLPRSALLRAVAQHVPRAHCLFLGPDMRPTNHAFDIAWQNMFISPAHGIVPRSCHESFRAEIPLCLYS